MASNVLLSCLVLVIFTATLSAGEKYGREANTPKDSENPFRTWKTNLIWNKAKKRLQDKEQLQQLYQDLKHQDQLEIDLKRRRSVEQDGDGEFEAMVRRKSLDIMLKYNLEDFHPDAPPKVNDIDGPRSQQQRWEMIMKDKKLATLWQKAQMSGFSEQELGALRSEFLHHADKLEELNQLQAQLKDPGLRDNTLKHLKDNEEFEVNLRKEKEKHRDLKKKYQTLRGEVEALEEKVISKKSFDPSIAGGFRHPKTINLWFAAKNGNFTEEELSSLQEELRHFEHKLKKLEYMETEKENMQMKLNDKMAHLEKIPDHQLKQDERLKDYSRKVKKHEADIATRINQASRHNEL